MKAVRYFVRILLFVALFVLALNNTNSVALNLPLGMSYTLPQVVWWMLFFVVGVVVSFFALLPRIWALKAEIRRLARANTDIYNQKNRVELHLKELEEEQQNQTPILQESTVNVEKVSNVPAPSL